jgi:hypothetical protein
MLSADDAGQPDRVAVNDVNLHAQHLKQPP